MPPPLLILANPASGAGRALAAAKTLLAALTRAGHPAALETSAGPGWMTSRAAAARDARAVVAVGGDGTANEVAQGLAGGKIPLAVFPAGTANLLARAYRLPATAKGFLARLESWRLIPLDLGTAGNRVFLSCAGAGFDAEVVHRLHARRRGPISALQYLPHAAAALLEGHTPMVRVALDGEDLGTFRQVVIGNLPLYAGVMSFTPDARADDGILDVALFPGGRRRDLIHQGLEGLAGSGRGVVLRRARTVRLEGGARLQLDGDDAGLLPVDIRVRPSALQLLG